MYKVIDRLFEQLSQLITMDNDIIDVEYVNESIIITSVLHLDHIHITVYKDGCCCGWNKKNTTKNDYTMTFEIAPISSNRIMIQAYWYGLVGQCYLYTNYNYDTYIWEYENTQIDYRYDSDCSAYPYINFPQSVNRQNQFTKFICINFNNIKHCLNDELHLFEDATSYDSEPPYNTADIEGDLILTIRDDTWNILRKKGCIKLSDESLIAIDKSMIGKKLIRKDSDPNVFYPLHEEDFQQYHKSEIFASI
jgi:hypothetical protein